MGGFGLSVGVGLGLELGLGVGLGLEARLGVGVGLGLGVGQIVALGVGARLADSVVGRPPDHIGHPGPAGDRQAAASTTIQTITANERR